MGIITETVITPAHQGYLPPAIRYARVARELLALHPSLAEAIAPVVALRALDAVKAEATTLRVRVVLGERMEATNLEKGISPYTEVEKVLSLALHRAFIKRARTTEGDIVGWRPSKIEKLVGHQVGRLIDEHASRRNNTMRRQDHGNRVHGGSFGSHIPVRNLCLGCRRVNAHGKGCARNESEIVMLRNKAIVPRHDASTSKWKEFMTRGAFHRPAPV